MGGNSGGIIVKEAAQSSLNEPTVHGNLPGHMTPALDHVLAKPAGTWTADDCKVVADVMHWALCHLA